MTLEFGSLVLCKGTVPGADLEEQARAAAGAGFVGISVGADQVKDAIDRAGSAEAVNRLMADIGVEIADFDAIINWLGGAMGPNAPKVSSVERVDPGEFMELAASVGARAVNIVDLSGVRREYSYVVDQYGKLCDMAGPLGLLVYMEFFRGSAIKDLATAGQVAADCGRPNSGALLDIFHYHRGRSAQENQISTWAKSVRMVQLSDCAAVAEPDPVEEMLHRRLLPGEGVVDLVAILAALRQAGSDAPVGVEIFSDWLAQMAPDEAARLAGDATRRVLAEVT